MVTQTAWNGVLLIVLAPALSACSLFSSGKPTAATCATQQTADGVKSAVFDAAGHSMMTNPRNAKAVGERIDATISNAVASNLDEKLARVDCSGDMTLRLPADFQSNIFRNGRTITRRISYSVQSTADGNGLLYTFGGDEELSYWAGFAAFTFYQPKAPAQPPMLDAPAVDAAGPTQPHVATEPISASPQQNADSNADALKSADEAAAAAERAASGTADQHKSDQSSESEN